MLRRLRLLAAALGAALLAPIATAQPALQRQVDAYAGSLAATHNFSGVVLIARGDRVLVHRAYGLASEELGAPNTPDSKFQLASVSKPLTAAAVLRFVERGKIDLQAPISAILPDFPNGANITVHQLLNHTSGLPNVNQMPIYAELGLKRRTPTEIVDAFKSAKVAFAPGARNSYSNSNYALLALILEKVSGKPYGEVMREEVFAPLGMTNSGHRGDQTLIIPKMTTGYAPQGRSGLKRPPWFDWTVKTGNGSLYSTAPDLHRFIRGYFGGKVVGPALVKAATTATAPSKTMGYGWMVGPHLDRLRYQHGGSSPGYSTQIAYYPDDQLTVVVLSNNYLATAQPVADAVAAMALGKPTAAGPINDAPLTDAAAARVVGRYKFGADFLLPNATMTVVREADGRLSIKGDTPLFRPAPLFPQSALVYVDRDLWSTITFEAEPGRPAGAVIMSGGDPLGGPPYAYRAPRVP